ncbi:MAG: PqqD family peptide modification chaperone [Ignavibacteriaceae bacterium]|nr:PqqD family peptide modification chaperone [Ignavibacteriaceae bacterium]
MFKKKSKINLNYLDLTPFRLHRYQLEDDGKVSVLVPRFTNKLLVKYLSSKIKSPDIKVMLDTFGSAAWLKADGEKKVSEIAVELLDQFGERINPVNERLTKFYTQLYTYKFISFNEIEER